MTTMAVATRKSREEAIRDLENVSEDEMAEAAMVVGYREQAGHPFSVRLSVPLLERLERLARQENRKRGNLIQHILWQYVQNHQVRE